MWLFYCTKVSLLIGLHPDEATEPLLDMALTSRTSFAVVPCCVFAHAFPKRRLRGEDRGPRTYEELCRYLREKAEDALGAEEEVREHRLGFRGRDKVIFWKGAKQPKQ